jgi:hypothetical protein
VVDCWVECSGRYVKSVQHEAKIELNCEELVYFVLVVCVEN